MIFGAFRTRYCMLISCKSCARPNLECFPITFMHKGKVDRITMESMQPRSNKDLLGPSSSMSCRVRCALPGTEQPGLRRVKLNPAFSINVCHNNVYFATVVTDFPWRPPYLPNTRCYLLELPWLDHGLGKYTLEFITIEVLTTYPVCSGHALIYTSWQCL